MRRDKAITIVIIMLVALALRLFMLGAKSLWLDEVFSVTQASQSGVAITADQYDVHPPGYYLFLHEWLGVGQSEFWVRLPSALLGTLTVLVIYRLGCLRSEQIGLIAAGLLAIDPMHIWYSQEARMYAALTCFAAIGVCCAIRLLRRATWIDWPGYALAMMLTIYFNYTGIALWIAAFIVITIGTTWRRAWTRAKLWIWLSAQVIVALSLLPLWPNLQRTLTVYPQGAVRIFIDKTLDSIPITIVLGGLVAGTISLGVIAALGMRAARRHESRAFITTVMKLAIVIGYALWLIAGSLPRLYTIKRQIVMFAPYLILATAFVFDSMIDSPVRAKRASAYALMVLAIGGSILNISVWPKEDWRGVAALVAQESIAGDAIINSPGWNTLPFGYYYQMHPGAPGRMVQSADDAHRVWLIVGESFDVYMTDPMRQQLEQSRGVIDRRQFDQIEVVLLK